MIRAELLALASRVEAATGADACWPWPRALDTAGRGRVWLEGRIMLAHRAVWTVMRGAIPPSALLCHHCDNPACVNPVHLYVGTHADNMRDMRVRRQSFACRQPERAQEVGRKSGLAKDWAAGSGNPKAKLTPEQVMAIRADRRPTREIVASYGVARTTVQRIRSGALWSAAALRALAEEAGE